jgi:hypothetical protein
MKIKTFLSFEKDMIDRKYQVRDENRDYLVKLMMDKLGLTEEDLERDLSYIKSKVREMRINEIIG